MIKIKVANGVVEGPPAVENYALETGGALDAIAAGITKIPNPGAAATAASTPGTIAIDDAGMAAVLVELQAQSAATTSTVFRVAASVTQQTLLAANPVRTSASFYCETTTGKLRIKHGAAATAVDYTVLLGPGDHYEMPRPVYTGVITGIWTVADGAVQITEGA